MHTQFRKISWSPKLLPGLRWGYSTLPDLTPVLGPMGLMDRLGLCCFTPDDLTYDPNDLKMTWLP